MYKLSEMFEQRGGSDAFGRRVVKNIGFPTDIGETFAETGTTGTDLGSRDLTCRKTTGTARVKAIAYNILDSTVS